MGAHHLWYPPRFVNRVENDVVDAMLNALVLALFVVMVVVSVERGPVLRRRGAAAAA